MPIPSSKTFDGRDMCLLFSRRCHKPYSQVVTFLRQRYRLALGRQDIELASEGGRHNEVEHHSNHLVSRFYRIHDQRAIVSSSRIRNAQRAASYTPEMANPSRSFTAVKNHRYQEQAAAAIAIPATTSIVPLVMFHMQIARSATQRTAEDEGQKCFTIRSPSAPINRHCDRGTATGKRR